MAKKRQRLSLAAANPHFNLKKLLRLVRQLRIEQNELIAAGKLDIEDALSEADLYTKAQELLK